MKDFEKWYYVGKDGTTRFENKKGYDNPYYRCRDTWNESKKQERKALLKEVLEILGGNSWQKVIGGLIKQIKKNAGYVFKYQCDCYLDDCCKKARKGYVKLEDVEKMLEG